MAKLSIHKTHNGENWVNVYYLQQAYDSASATTEAQGLVDFERSLHLPQVLITHYNLNDGEENTDAYFTVPVNQFGTSALIGEAAPLFNTLRIDFSKLGGGRPGRKFYRGVLTEQVMLPFGKLDTAYVAARQSEAQAVMDANTAGGENFTYVTASVHPQVAMRQLRRGSKKKNIPSTPIPV